MLGGEITFITIQSIFSNASSELGAIVWPGPLVWSVKRTHFNRGISGLPILGRKEDM